MSISKLSFIAALCFSVLACSSAQHRAVIDESFDAVKKSLPVQEEVLSCFADMLATYWRKNGQPRVIRAAVIDFKDATSVSSVQYPNSEIPPEFSDFGVTALSKIGYPLQVVHVPKESELISAVRYSGLKKGSYLDSYIPKPYDVSTIQLYGALTEYDRFVVGKNTRADGAFDFGSGDTEGTVNSRLTRVNNQARMTMDVHVVRGAVGDVITRANAFNTVYLSQDGKDFEIGLGVQGDSLGYSRSVSTVDARHLAMRLLVESNVIEAIGKYAYVPYFRCYEQEKSDFQPASTYSLACPYQQALLSVEGEELIEEGVDCEPGVLSHPQAEASIEQALFYFNKAEYYLNGKRYYVARPDVNQSLSNLITVTDAGVQKQLESIIIRGRNEMLDDLFSIHALAQNVDLAAVKTNVHSQYKFDTQALFSYLWLNAPIIKGRRWH